MLKVNANSRLKTFKEIKEDVWFDNFNWHNLMNFTIDPPYAKNMENDSNEKKEPFLDYVNNFKEWKPKNGQSINETDNFDFESWYNFF